LRTISTGVFETRLRLTDNESAVFGGSCREKEGSSTTLNDLLSQLENASADSLQSSANMSSSHSVNAAASGLSDPSGSSNPSAIPAKKVFVMEKNHATVAELWKEWTQGVFGRPSVDVMVTQGYSKSEAQRKLFSRRKVIVDEVVRLAKERTEPEGHIVTALDIYLSASKMSVSKLQEVIKERTKQGKSGALWLEGVPEIR
jgi:hypothetical protein